MEELELTDAVDLNSWRAAAPIGDRITYFTGYLANQRSRAVGEIAAAAWSLAEKGRVCLVQKKLSAGVYDYIAVASALRPWPEKLS